jgi:hypothetical protein
MFYPFAGIEKLTQPSLTNRLKQTFAELPDARAAATAFIGNTRLLMLRSAPFRCTGTSCKTWNNTACCTLFRSHTARYWWHWMT